MTSPSVSRLGMQQCLSRCSTLWKGAATRGAIATMTARSLRRMTMSPAPTRTPAGLPSRPPPPTPASQAQARSEPEALFEYTPTLSPSHLSRDEQFTHLVTVLRTNPSALSQADVLYLLSTDPQTLPDSESPHLSVSDMKQLYTCLLALPSQRFVLETSHYLSLLRHLCYQHESTWPLTTTSITASSSDAVMPSHSLLALPSDAHDFIASLISDMKSLRIPLTPAIHSYILLSHRSLASLPSVIDSLPTQTLLHLPTLGRNVLLHHYITTSVPLTKRTLWSHLTALKTAGHTPDIHTYTLLLHAFGRLNDAKSLRKVLLHLNTTSGDQPWTRDTLRAVLHAVAVRGDEKRYNALMYRMRTSRVGVDAHVLVPMMLFWVWTDRPRVAVRLWVKHRRSVGKSVNEEMVRVLVDAMRTWCSQISSSSVGLRNEALGVDEIVEMWETLYRAVFVETPGVDVSDKMVEWMGEAYLSLLSTVPTTTTTTNTISESSHSDTLPNTEPSTTTPTPADGADFDLSPSHHTSLLTHPTFPTTHLHTLASTPLHLLAILSLPSIPSKLDTNRFLEQCVEVMVEKGLEEEKCVEVVRRIGKLIE
ncbi:hypothetical protein BC832DRAFT_125481 [Gaertneriomyces semiglobifer]|nr:hypothetical protein BC832DRAFT_125481 [Gaertneriomyces semiglobifer]